MYDAVTELLKRAREQIAVPERWTKKVQARNGDGKEVRSNDPDACQWCAMGAITSLTSDVELIIKAIRSLNRRAPPTRGTLKPIAAFNDRRTTDHADIIALFDRTIADLEAANA